MLGDNCTSSLDCFHAVSDSFCSGDVCTCLLGYAASNSGIQCTKRKITDTCTQDGDCFNAVENSKCDNGTCACALAHEKAGNETLCIQNVLPVPCDPKTSQPCGNSSAEICAGDVGNTYCQCRPGYARLFPTDQCKKAKRFSVEVSLTHLSDEPMVFSPELLDQVSQNFTKLKSQGEYPGFDDAFLRTMPIGIYLGANVTNFFQTSNGVGMRGTIAFDDSATYTAGQIRAFLLDSLNMTSEILGVSGLAVEVPIEGAVRVGDINECSDQSQHDCSAFAICINTEGSFTCECETGYDDINSQFPGRYCNEIKTETTIDRCDFWHAGSNCEVDLRIVVGVMSAVALVGIGLIAGHFIKIKILTPKRAVTPTPDRYSRQLSSAEKGRPESVLTTSSEKERASDGLVVKDNIFGEPPQEQVENVENEKFADDNPCTEEDLQ
ncbi:uncharacterized protein LOC135497810 [Lineus longissimus]|uniref:uncharacterized protein LOC135497810 n=1 Tax=Lineus longissimus TaxID=88925 RepID=UPI00315CE141